jgi:Protein of unknown function (DUF2934)
MATPPRGPSSRMTKTSASPSAPAHGIARGADAGKPADAATTVTSTNLERREAPSLLADREARIAEAAYWRAARRGFMPGAELDDWLAAEQEIDASDRESRRSTPPP